MGVCDLLELNAVKKRLPLLQKQAIFTQIGAAKFLVIQVQVALDLAYETAALLLSIISQKFSSCLSAHTSLVKVGTNRPMRPKRCRKMEKTFLWS